jgi:hypothetical protein
MLGYWTGTVVIDFIISDILAPDFRFRNKALKGVHTEMLDQARYGRPFWSARIQDEGCRERFPLYTPARQRFPLTPNR